MMSTNILDLEEDVQTTLWTPFEVDTSIFFLYTLSAPFVEWAFFNIMKKTFSMKIA